MSGADTATTPQSRPSVGVALKFVPLRVEVNPLTGMVSADDRLAGASPADEAALEYGLRFAEAWGWDLLVASAGDHRCEPMLRAAMAAGANAAIRVVLPTDTAAPVVAAALAEALGDCLVLLCGDYSLDRGTGSVPAYLAAQLGAAQALGLVSVAAVGEGTVEGERRLDGGRRERLRIPAPAVLSVEAGVRLRRAPLPAVLRARSAPLQVLPTPVPYAIDPAAGTRRPYRPRPKALPSPTATMSARDRVLMLTGALSERRTPAAVRTNDPVQGADIVLTFLRERGYIS